MSLLHVYPDALEFPPFFRWLYDIVDAFVIENSARFENNLTRDVHKELDRQLYLIVSDSIHGRLYPASVDRSGVVQESEKRIRLAVNQTVSSSNFGTVLHYVACQGYAMVLRLLLERRGNPNVLGVNEETPLQRAILLYNESKHEFMKEAYLNVISVLLCYQADRQRLKPGIPCLHPALNEEFRKQMLCNEKGYMSVLSKQVKTAVHYRDAKKFREIISKGNLGLLNLITSRVPEFDNLPFEIGVLYEAVKRDERVTQVFNNGYTKYVHRIDGDLENHARHPEMPGLDFMKTIANSYYKWGNYIRENLRLLAFLKECYYTIFSELHRTPDVNPNNGANLLHYFITIPYFPLCQLVLAHSPEFIHGQDYMGNTPLHCAFFQAMEEEPIFEPIIQQLTTDNFVMHFFDFNKFNLAKQTLLHLFSERGTKSQNIVSVFGTRICNYIATQIRSNRYSNVCLNISDSGGWTPFIQLCHKNDPLALPMAQFAHEQKLDVNQTCPGTNYTALHLAVQHSQRLENGQISKLLLDTKLFKHLRVSSFDLITKSSSFKLYEKGFKLAPLWAIEQYRSESGNSPGPARNNLYDRFLKRITLHPPVDRDYGEIESDILDYLTVSPLLEVLITEWTELFELIAHHPSISVVDSCRGLKLALELGHDDYVKPLICNLVKIARVEWTEQNENPNKRLHIDLHEGHLNTWCLERILCSISDEEFRFEDCPKVPIYLFSCLEGKLNFSHVASIDLSGNSLDRIPDSLLFLTEVTYLNLQVNDIEFIPDVQFSPKLAKDLPLPALKELNIKSNRLKGTIPLWIFCHKNLEKLNLAQNSLNFFQDKHFDEFGLTEFETKIKEVSLQKNEITHIPRYIKKWKNIISLNLSENSLKMIPREIWSLNKLDQLDLSDNLIDRIEYIHDASPNIPIDALENRNHTTILEGEKSNGQSCRLRELRLSSNKLQEPPKLVNTTPNLHYLFLKENIGITYLDLNFLPRFLRYLDFSDCRIGEIIFSPNNIQQGMCDHISDRKKQFIFLTDLYLNGNLKLQNIILGKGGNSKELYFPHLKHLHLHENDLRSLPPHIGFQTNLELLDLSSNLNLHELPLQIAELQKYNKLTILLKERVRLEDIPQEASISTILNRMQYKGTECQQSRRFKLTVIGNEGTGKTTLLKNLKCNRSVQSSELLTINTWELTNPNEKEDRIDFEVWDLNGKQDCYPIPSWLISTRSIYLVLFRACDRYEGVRKLKSWLVTLDAMAPGCPVLIVGTHIENMEKMDIEILANEIMRKYHPNEGPFPEIADICFIANKPGILVSNREQLNSLKRAIFEIVIHIHKGVKNRVVSYKPKTSATHPNACINQLVPISFKDLEREIALLRTKLEKEGSPHFLNLMELWNSVGTQLFKSKELFTSGLEYLHNLGILFKFEEIDLYFLSPILLCELFSILTPHHEIYSIYSKQRKSIYAQSQSNIELISLNKTKEHEKIGRETFSTDLQNTGTVGRNMLVKFLFSEYEYLKSETMNTLMELFTKLEYIIRTKDDELILPAFLPDSPSYNAKLVSEKSLLPDNLKIDTDLFHIGRFFFLDHMPYGFWPRLIARFKGDKILNDFFQTRNRNIRYFLSKSTFEIRYKCCLIFKLVCEESNKVNHVANIAGLVHHFYLIRIDINLFVWSVLAIEDDKSLLTELTEERKERIPAIIDNIRNIIPSAAILLHRLSRHYNTFFHLWYSHRNTYLSDTKSGSLTFYTPCQKCLGGSGSEEREYSGSDPTPLHIYYSGKKMNIFSENDCIRAAFKNEKISCKAHGWNNFEVTCPDLFMHMRDTIAQKSVQLEINHKDILHCGIYRLFCRGTIYQTEERSNAVRNIQLNKENGKCMLIYRNNEQCGAKDRDYLTFAKTRLPSEEVALKFALNHSLQKREHFKEFLDKNCISDVDFLNSHSTILNEMSFCIGLKHRNVVKLLGVGFETVFYLIFEMAPFGDLNDIVEKYRVQNCRFEYEVVLKTLEEICTGLKYLHEVAKIIHRLIKLSHILVWSYPLPDQNGEIKSRDVHLKISDFSCAFIHSNMGNKVCTPLGFRGYFPPEVVSKNYKSIDYKVDMFGVGIVLYQLLNLTSPPCEISQLKDYMQQYEGQSPFMLNQFVVKCVETDVDKRLSSSEALQWLNTAEMRQTEMYAFNTGRFTAIIRTEATNNLLHSVKNDQSEETCFLVDLANERLVSTNLVVETITSRQLRVQSNDTEKHKHCLNQQDSLKKDDRIGSNDKCHMLISSEKSLENNEPSSKSLSILSINLDNRNVAHRNLLNSFQYRIFAIKLIESSLWLGTNKGNILVYKDIRALQNTQFTPYLKVTLINTTREAMVILDIQHLPKWNCVIATTNLGDIFFIEVKEILSTRANSVTCLHCHLSPVKMSQAINRALIIQRLDEVQIWCTRGSITNPLTVLHLPLSRDVDFKETTLQSRIITQPLHYITSATYRNAEDCMETTVWTSIMNRSLIASWDADNMNKPDIISIKEVCDDSGNSPLITVTALYTANEVLYVGTSNGCILRYAMSGSILSVLKWFIGSVREVFKIPHTDDDFGAFGEGLQLLRSSLKKRKEVEYNQDEAIFVTWREIEDKGFDII